MKEFIDIRITGYPDELKAFALLCTRIQSCGAVGACRTIPVVVDGDGSGQLQFALLDEHGQIACEFPTVPVPDTYPDVWIGE